MGAGSMQDRIGFLRQSSDQDEYGNETGKPVPLFSTWADIREVPGKEAIANGALGSTRTATVRVRMTSKTLLITPADLISARGVMWNIRSGPVQVDRTKSLLEFTVETGVAI